MSWQAEIDARLVARLVRAGQPGLIGMCVARRIVGAVEQMAGRLPLLARFPRVTERSRAGETAIVHALPVAAPGAERSDSGPPSERVLRVVTARTVERERVLERSIVERAAVPPRSQGAESRARADAMPPHSQGAESPARTDAMRPSAEPAARRSRMGAPLATSTLPPVMPVAAPVQRSVANAPMAAPSTLLPAVPVVAPVRRSVANTPMAAPPAVLGSRQPAASSTETPLAIVAPRRLPSSASGPTVVWPVLTLPRSVEIDAASGPIVEPRRSLAPRAEASLAHVAPAPAAASAAPKPDATPSVAPRVLAVTPLRTKDAASPISQPLQRADLPEIAARVQRIMERQALHDRARRGLRR